MKRLGLIVLMISVSVLQSAAGADLDDGLAKSLKQRLEKNFPKTIVEHVRSAPMSGLYEVVTENQIAYTNKDGSLLFVGRIMDSVTKEDLTNKSWNEVRAINFNSLPLDAAIKTVRGNGSRKMAVFSDPDCPYCEELEKELVRLDNVTIYTFLFPLEKIHPDAAEKARKIWCSENREQTWSAWMLKRIAPPLANCDNDPLKQLKTLADSLKINSTPTLFFVDGHRVANALTVSQLEKELEGSIIKK